MANHHHRQSSVDRASIESILKTGEAGQPAAPPSPYIGNSPSRSQFAVAAPVPTRPVTKHARALSYTPTPRRPNRLSLSFPIASNVNGLDSPRPTPTSSNTTSFPPTPANSVGPEPSPTDPSAFLVALASQERRVLELKEELQKAEADLEKLKRQWARHEGHKKKAEIQRAEPLQPLTTVVTDGGKEEPTVTPRQSAEMERRKTLLNNLNVPKDEKSRRKFSGTHTRALSLLSPERSNFSKPLPSPANESGDMAGISRTPTMPDTSYGIPKVSSNRAAFRHSYQGGVTHNAKQIAEDVKAGLWTFLEDLRQATVGDEAVNGTTNRSIVEGPPLNHNRKNSKGNHLLGNDRSKHSPRTRTWESLTGGDALIDIAEPFWQDNNPTTSKAPATAKKTRPLSLAAPDLDDDWSSWDSPTPKSPRWSGSSTLSDLTPATPSNRNVEDRNVKYASTSSFPHFIQVNEPRIRPVDGSSTPASKHDEIQWPALDKLSPTNIRGGLQRTMSTLMKEWEKSITSPTDHRSDPFAKQSVNEKQSQELVDVSTQDDVVMMSR